MHKLTSKIPENDGTVLTSCFASHTNTPHIMIMPRMQKYITHIVLCAFLLTNSRLVFSQVDGKNPSSEYNLPVELSPEQSCDFKTAIKEIATHKSLTVIAEGTPLHSKIPHEIGVKIASSSTLNQQVYRLANAYDYDIVKVGNALVLIKRYTDPHDLPLLTREEISISISRELQIINKFYVSKIGKDYWSTGEGFVDHLSSSEIGELLSHNLRLSTLSQDRQKTVLELEAYSRLNQTEDLMAQAQAWLSQDPKTIIFQWKLASDFRSHTPLFNGTTSLSQSYFGFHIAPVHREDTNYFVPLSGYYAQNSGFDGGNISLELHFTHDPEQQSANDLSAPENDISTTEPDSSSLQSAILAINKESKDGESISIEDSIKAKLITIVEPKNSKIADLARAIAIIYGLEVNKVILDKRPVYHVAIPAFHLPDTYSDLSTALQAVLPAPINRAMHLHEYPQSFVAGSTIKTGRKDAKDEDLTELQAAMEERRVQHLSSTLVMLPLIPKKVHLAAVAHLRRLVEPVLKTEKSEKISLMALDEDTKNAFANVVFTGLLSDVIAGEEIYASTKPFEFVKDMYVGGELIKNKGSVDRIMLYLCLLDRDNKTRFQCEFGQFPFRKQDGVMNVPDSLFLTVP